jgi:type IV pilus assembly protein PilE
MNMGTLPGKRSMKSSSCSRVRTYGFTLIEVMITVAIIAIIASVALPSYFEYVTRSRIVEAKTNLSDMRTRLEQYFFDNRAYPTACIAAASGAPGAGNIYLPAGPKFFNSTCALTATTYTVTATGTGSMAGFVYTIDQSNTRATTSTGSWGKSSTTCWISKKSGEC